MARNFSRRHKMTPMTEINVTPLLDLCFCLLVIFMITTPVLEQTTKIELPQASAAAGTSPSNDAQYRYVAIDKAGEFFLDDRAISADELSEVFSDIASRSLDAQPTVRIRADGNIAYRVVVSVFDLAKKSGLTKVAIDTEIAQESASKK